jgi:hypothetical protein
MSPIEVPSGTFKVTVALNVVGTPKWDISVAEATTS